MSLSQKKFDLIFNRLDRQCQQFAVGQDELVHVFLALCTLKERARRTLQEKCQVSERDLDAFEARFESQARPRVLES